MKNTEKLCEAEVRKNIVLVETGQPLTLPLATLNRSCEFRKFWEKTYDLWHPEDSQKAYKKAYRKAYYQRPEVKAYQKAYKKAYYQRTKNKNSKLNTRPNCQARDSLMVLNLPLFTPLQAGAGV